MSLVWSMGRTEVTIIKIKVVYQNSYVEGMGKTENSVG